MQGRSQDLAGGGPRIFFFRFGNLHVAKRHVAHGEAMRFVRGVRGHAPPRKFFKMVRFGVYFDQILSLKNFNNYHFLSNNFKNCNFLDKRINICYGVIILVKKFLKKFMIYAFWYVF